MQRRAGKTHLLSMSAVALGPWSMALAALALPLVVPLVEVIGSLTRPLPKRGSDRLPETPELEIKVS